MREYLHACCCKLIGAKKDKHFFVHNEAAPVRLELSFFALQFLVGENCTQNQCHAVNVQKLSSLRGKETWPSAVKVAFRTAIGHLSDLICRRDSYLFGILAKTAARYCCKTLLLFHPQVNRSTEKKTLFFDFCFHCAYLIERFFGDRPCKPYKHFARTSSSSSLLMFSEGLLFIWNKTFYFFFHQNSVFTWWAPVTRSGLN